MTDRTTISAEINNFYSRELLERARPLLVHNKWAETRDIAMKSGTDTIKFRKYNSLDVQTTALTEGVTPVGGDLSITDITAQIEYYGYYITLTDKLQYETIDPILMETQAVLGEQAGDSLDVIFRDIINAGTNVRYASTATARDEVTAAMTLDRDEVKQAVLNLDNSNAKQITKMIDSSDGFNTTALRPAYIGIVHPDTAYDLEEEEGFKYPENYSSKTDIMEGEIGELAGVRFIKTTNAKIFEGEGLASANVYSTIIFGARAMGVTRLSGMAMQSYIKPLGSAGTSDPLDQRATAGWKASFTGIILQQPWIVRVEHGASQG